MFARNRAADSLVIHKLAITPLVFLIAGAFVRKRVAAVRHKRSQLHSCVRLKKTSSNSEASCLFWAPFSVSAAVIPQMACSEGQEGRLFNPVQCKHDPFEWPGTSQDILVWADLPKQPRGATPLRLSLRDKSLSYRSSRSAQKVFLGDRRVSHECWFFFSFFVCLFDVIFVQTGSQLLEQGLSCQCIFSPLSCLI